MRFLDGLVASRASARHEDQAKDSLGDEVEDAVDENLRWSSKGESPWQSFPRANHESPRACDSEPKK